jgi:hypothetical protein
MIFLWVAEMVEESGLVRVFYCLTIWSLGLAKNLSSWIGKNRLRPVCAPRPNFSPCPVFAPFPVYAPQWLELSHDSRPCLRLLGFQLGLRSEGLAAVVHSRPLTNPGGGLALPHCTIGSPLKLAIEHWRIPQAVVLPFRLPAVILSSWNSVEAHVGRGRCLKDYLYYNPNQ